MDNTINLGHLSGIETPIQLQIKLGENEASSYDGSSSLFVDVTPEAIGAAEYSITNDVNWLLQNQTGTYEPDWVIPGLNTSYIPIRTVPYVTQDNQVFVGTDDAVFMAKDITLQAFRFKMNLLRTNLHRKQARNSLFLYGCGVNHSQKERLPFSS